MMKAVAEIHAAEYLAAIADLGTLNRNETLTRDQKQAVASVISQVLPLLPPQNAPLAPMAPSK